MILVDTSVWVDHFRRRDPRLVEALELESVVMHPFVLGEIACGSLSDRATIIELLQQLPSAAIAEPDEALDFIARHKLYGKGIGYVDAHLLASVAIDRARLWTRDRRLSAVARTMGYAFVETGAH